MPGGATGVDHDLEPDGDMVIVYQVPGGNFGVTKLNPDGTRDSVCGPVTVNLGGNDLVRAIDVSATATTVGGTKDGIGFALQLNDDCTPNTAVGVTSLETPGDDMTDVFGLTTDATGAAYVFGESGAFSAIYKLNADLSRSLTFGDDGTDNDALFKVDNGSFDGFVDGLVIGSSIHIAGQNSDNQIATTHDTGSGAVVGTNQTISYGGAGAGEDVTGNDLLANGNLVVAGNIGAGGTVDSTVSVVDTNNALVGAFSNDGMLQLPGLAANTLNFTSDAAALPASVPVVFGSADNPGTGSFDMLLTVVSADGSSVANTPEDFTGEREQVAGGVDPPSGGGGGTPAQGADLSVLPELRPDQFFGWEYRARSRRSSSTRGSLTPRTQS